MFRSRSRTLQPCRIPKIEQHLRTGGETVSREVERGRRAFAGEPSCLLEGIDVFHHRVRVSKISDVLREGLVEALRRLYEASEVLSRDVGCNVCGFKL